MNDIEREWQYRYEEALALGRTERRARIEADEWRKLIESHPIGFPKHENNRPGETENQERTGEANQVVP